MNIVTRFAPSPTGYLHIGGLRTALFSYLWARHSGGIFRLRIEDTDRKRFVADADKKLIEVLAAFGMNPDGEIVYQSKRAEAGIYREVAETLIESGHAYYCFCTEERLKELREKRIAQKLPPGYDGRCRSIDRGDAAKRVASGEAAVVRFLFDATDKVVVTDGLRGEVSFSREALEDSVLLKSDGYPTYHLAHIVDDHEMEVSDVIRGEEWLPSAPLHTRLYEALGWELPRLWHIPLILNADKTKLSKRQGDVAVEHYLEKWYLKDAILNYVALLGWHPGNDRELYSMNDLIAAFDVSRLALSPAVFDVTKLKWFNAEYIKRDLAPKQNEDILAAIRPYLAGTSDEKALKLFSLFFERIHTLDELPIVAQFLEDCPPYEPELLVFKKSDKDKTLQGLLLARDVLKDYEGEWTAINVELELKKATERVGLTPGDVFWPVRVALSGLEASPPPTELLAILERDESFSRIEKAIKLLQAMT